LYENFIFSAGVESSAAQFDKTSGNLVRKFSIDSSLQVASVAVSEDGQWLFTGSQDPTAFLVQWSISDGTRIRNLEGSLIYNNSRRLFEFSNSIDNFQ
jgi:hypothetical protein